MAERYLIVGLGNPGKKYENTRHNMGFWVLDELVRRYNLSFNAEERKAKVCDGVIKGRRVLLAKPQTFMNKSGESVRALADFYKIAPSEIIVVYDDLDTPFETLKIRGQGGHGGNNGIRSIIQHLGTQDFARIKCGIGRPPGKMDPAAYVLKPFGGDDEIAARQMADRAADAVETWLVEGVEQTMTQHNGDGKTPPEPKTTPEDELALAERAHQLAPNDPKPLEKMASILNALGKVDLAAERHLQAAELHQSQGRQGAAIKQRERAASVRPDRVDLHERIADDYLKQGNTKKAVQRYLTLADYLRGHYDPAGALKAVQAALEINPQHPKALELQQALTKQIAE